MLKDKQQLAKAVTDLLKSKFVLDELAKQVNHTDLSKIKKSVANILYFMVATRSTNLSKDVIKDIIHSPNVPYACIAKQIKNDLMLQGIEPTNQLVFDVLKANIHTNGIYMHSYSQVNHDNILKHGLSPNFQSFAEERNHLNYVVTDYEYEFRANRVYVTSMYEVLYGYGSYSPEWVSEIVKNDEAMLYRDYNKAMLGIEQKIETVKDITPERKQILLSSADKIIKHYLNKDKQQICIAMINKFETNEHGKRLFNRYDEEEMGLEDKLFEEQHLQNLFFNTSKDNNEFLEKSIKYLIDKGTIYELSTIDSVKIDQISIATLPSIGMLNTHTLKKQSERQQ